MCISSRLISHYSHSIWFFQCIPSAKNTTNQLSLILKVLSNSLLLGPAKSCEIFFMQCRDKKKCNYPLWLVSNLRLLFFFLLALFLPFNHHAAAAKHWNAKQVNMSLLSQCGNRMRSTGSHGITYVLWMWLRSKPVFKG